MSESIHNTTQPDAYELYKKIVSEIPADATVRIPWYPQVAADKEADVRKKLHSASEEELAEAIEASKYKEDSEQRQQLVENHLSGSITDLFKKMLVLETTGEGDLEEITSENNRYMKVPEQYRLGAFVLQNGYYHGGFYTSFEEQAQVDSEASVLEALGGGMSDLETDRMKIIAECGIARNGAWEDQSFAVLNGIDDVEAHALSNNEKFYKED